MLHLHHDVRDTTTVLFQGWLVVAVVTCLSSGRQECRSVGFSQPIMILFFLGVLILFVIAVNFLLPISVSKVD
jgi:hypothetical protein